MAISFSSVFLLSCFFFINLKGFCDADQCRVLEFTPEKAFDGKRLINHVIRIVEVLTMSFCDNMCYMEPDCVSINVHKQVSGHCQTSRKLLFTTVLHTTSKGTCKS